ncbi:Cof-type HAD-IIB family hydrolase [Micromonospora radicis]|uniref:HAD family phosphatase n=1 Tax=Micromonospora radicis TaxID=1894971 RepID=A0A418MPU5_9ACTN|nr:HAD family hydrolase [Micromonospora radicis]RIV34577.1 HAD family phosphatase [Micromonospora radicis]
MGGQGPASAVADAGTVPLGPARIGLVALDIDGTLIDSPRSDRIAPAVVDAVRRVREAGVPVVLVSGRTHAMMTPYRDVLAAEPVLGSANGAVVRDDHDILRRATLPADAIAWAVRIAERFDLDVMFYGVDDLSVFPVAGHLHEPGSTPEARWTRVGARLIADPVRELAGTSVVKLVFIAADEIAAERITVRVRRELPSWAGTSELARSSGGAFGLEAPGADKGSALALIAEGYGVPLDRILAIGDHENDLPMLRVVGHPVAMGNSPPQVRALTHFTTASVTEDGVALALRRHLPWAFTDEPDDPTASPAPPDGEPPGPEAEGKRHDQHIPHRDLR